MQIKDVMTRDVEVIDSDSTVFEAAEIMKREDIGLLPVLDGQKLIGTLTDRDIVLRAVAEGRDCLHTTVSEIVSGEVVYCFEDQDIQGEGYSVDEIAYCCRGCAEDVGCFCQDARMLDPVRRTNYRRNER